MDLWVCNLSGCEVSFVPIAAAFVAKIGVVEEVDCARGSDPETLKSRN